MFTDDLFVCAFVSLKRLFNHFLLSGGLQGTTPILIQRLLQRVYRLQTGSLNISMLKNWCCCTNSLCGPSNWSLLTSALTPLTPSKVRRSNSSFGKKGGEGGIKTFKLQEKILNRHIKIFPISSSFLLL